MYNTDSKILTHICQLVAQILLKYELTDSDKIKLMDARTVLLNLVRKIDDK
jgi:hypothetical protein